jgi:putative glycosyltransferase (TIGR04348 family)
VQDKEVIIQICLVTPTLLGNQTTAKRLAKLLQGLGHSVVVRQDFDREKYDLLIALHARRSAPSIKKFHELHTKLPIILILTGTDLYHDIRSNMSAKASLEVSTRLVTLQTLGPLELSPHLRRKTWSIVQSATPTSKPQIKVSVRTGFQVAVVGGLRPVKDPFRTAMAVRNLPTNSSVKVVHVGPAMSPQMERRALSESKRNPRYSWLGEQSYSATRQIINDSDLLVLSSRSEGGANVICESISDSTPILASRIPGSIGILGDDYPGYFPTGNTKELARLISLAETNKEFLEKLKTGCFRLKKLVSPETEKAAWKNLLEDIIHQKI